MLSIGLMIGTPTSAQIAEGSMECTVTGVSVTASEEGKFKSYSGIEGLVKSNEKVILTYRSSWSGLFSIQLERTIETKNKVIISQLFSTEHQDVIAESSGAKGYVFNGKDFGNASLLEDYIRVANFSTLVLHRYYKSDWHGIYSRIYYPEPLVFTLSLNCRHRNNQIEAVWEVLKKIKSKN